MTDTAPPDFTAVPVALRDRPQWLVWRLEQKPNAKKPAKMPYYASGKRRTGVQGTEKDRAALVTFDAAQAAMLSLKADGIGFAFLPGDGLIGIDLDNAVDAETGELSPRVQKIIEACASYTEWSPSGAGFHCYVLGTTETAKDNGIGVEMFCGRQFFTVTGRHLAGTPAEVTAISDKVLRRLHVTIAQAKGGFTDKPDPAPKPAPAAPAAGRPTNERERIQSALDAVDPSSGYDEWYQIGMALHDGLGNAGLDVWDAWSARSDKYPGRHVIEQHWRSFKPGKVRIATLYHHAKARGWKPVRLVGGSSKRIFTPPTAPAGETKTDFEALLWRYGLWRNDAGNPRPIRENVVHMLTEHPKLKDLAGYNIFAHRIEKRIDPPWGGGTGEWKAQDNRELADWLAHEAGLLLKLKDVQDATSLVAWRSQINPVRDLFLALPAWDEVPRLDFWLTECLGAPESNYTRLVGRKFIMGMVNRILNPGCKFDYMLILEGEQGLGKSSTFRTLAWQDEWFNDTPFSANLDKDARLALHGCLIYEISEMHAFNKADSNAVKVFVSQMDDKLRAPYAEQHETFKRSMVFGGTTNKTEYFRDRTGNRRFWPVAVLLADLARLREWREQMFAEAMHRLKLGESVFPTREEERDLCQPEQKKRLIVDPWQDFVEAWLIKPEHAMTEFLSYVEIFEMILRVEPSRIDARGEMGDRVRDLMDGMGWIQARDKKGQRRGFKPGLDVPMPIGSSNEQDDEPPHPF